MSDTDTDTSWAFLNFIKDTAEACPQSSFKAAPSPQSTVKGKDGIVTRPATNDEIKEGLSKLRVLENEGGGNCFPLALSQLLFKLCGLSVSASAIRSLVTEALRNSGVDYLNFLDENCNLDEFTKKISLEGTFFDAVALHVSQKLMGPSIPFQADFLFVEAKMDSGKLVFTQHWFSDCGENATSKLAREEMEKKGSIKEEFLLSLPDSVFIFLYERGGGGHFRAISRPACVPQSVSVSLNQRFLNNVTLGETRPSFHTSPPLSHTNTPLSCARSLRQPLRRKLMILLKPLLHLWSQKGRKMKLEMRVMKRIFV